MSEVARNIRRRFKQTNLDTPSANSNSPNLGVYSNQRVIPRTQRTDRGVSQFLSDISGMISNNYRDKVMNQAEIDAATGEETEEYQNNALYRQTVSTAQAKRDGIELAKRAEVELADAYTARIENGEEFSVEDFVASRFQEAVNASNDEDYQSALARIQGQVTESLIPKAAAIDAARQAREADETAADIVFTTFANVQDPADIDDAAQILDTTLDEMGFNNKDKRGIILSGYLNEIDKATDLERVEMLSNKINTWLRKEDRGLLRRNSDDIRSVVEGAKRRIEIADEEARRKNAAEYDDNYLTYRQMILEDPTSVSDSQLNEAVEEMGVNDREQRSRLMSLKKLKQSGLQKIQQQQEARRFQQEGLSAIVNYFKPQEEKSDAESDGNMPAVLPDWVTKDHKNLFIELRSNKVFKAPLEDTEGNQLPPGNELLRAAVQDPSSENMLALSKWSTSVADLVKQANELGVKAPMVEQMMPNVSPDHPRFQSGALLYGLLQSKRVTADLDMSEEAEARFRTYNFLTEYMSPEEAREHMVRQADQDIDDSKIRSDVKDVIKSEMGNIMEAVVGDDDALNTIPITDRVEDLASVFMRHSPGGAETAVQLATELVAERTSVVDGIAVSNKVVDPRFTATYKTDPGFRSWIEETALEKANLRSLPENWVLRNAPSRGRLGYLQIFDPETGTLIFKENGDPLVINPFQAVVAYNNKVTEMSKDEAMEIIRGARSGELQQDRFNEAANRATRGLTISDREQLQNQDQ